MKFKALIVILIPLLFVGCDDLFDKGDAEATFDGNPQVEFKPLQQEVDQSEGTINLSIQLIGEQRGDDLQVSFTVSSTSTAVEGTHYNLNGTSATISAGTSATSISIDLIDGSLASGEEVTLILDLDDAGDVSAAPNLDQSITYISAP